MKNFFVFLLLCLLTLSSCAGGERAPDILGYELTAGELSLSFRADGQEFSATLARTDGKRRLSFSAPATLAGMSFSLDGETVTARFADGGGEVNGDFPLPRAIFDCFSLSERVARGELEFVSSGTSGGEDLFVFSDGETRYELYRAEGNIPSRIVRRSGDGVLTIDIM